MRTEAGTTVPAPSSVWTGSKHDGTESFFGANSRALGGSLVRQGRPDGSGWDGPLSSGSTTGPGKSKPLYGLSGVFEKAGRFADREFDLASDNESPQGLWSDGTTLWVSDSSQNRVSGYNVGDETGNVVQGFDLHIDNNSARGVIVSDGTMWVVDAADGVFAYDVSGSGTFGAWLGTGPSWKLHSGNGAPEGAWTDGETVWVVEGGNDKLYAYSLTGVRREQHEFDLHDDNGSPLGVWSDGRIVWGLGPHRHLRLRLLPHRGAGQAAGAVRIRPHPRQCQSPRHLVRRDHHVGGRCRRSRQALRLPTAGAAQH